MYYTAQIPLNSAQNQLPSPFCSKAQLEEQKAESALPGYKSPSPTFSRNSRPLISGFSWHVSWFCGMYLGDVCVPAICCRCHSFCLCVTFASQEANRKPFVLNRKGRSWGLPKSEWGILIQQGGYGTPNILCETSGSGLQMKLPTGRFSKPTEELVQSLTLAFFKKTTVIPLLPPPFCLHGHAT